MLAFRGWAEAAVPAGHLPGLCGSKDPLESGREQRDTGSVFGAPEQQAQGTHPSRPRVPSEEHARRTEGCWHPAPSRLDQPQEVPTPPAVRRALTRAPLPQLLCSLCQASLGCTNPFLRVFTAPQSLLHVGWDGTDPSRLQKQAGKRPGLLCSTPTAGQRPPDHKQAEQGVSLCPAPCGLVQAPCHEERLLGQSPTLPTLLGKGGERRGAGSWAGRRGDAPGGILPCWGDTTGGQLQPGCSTPNPSCWAGNGSWKADPLLANMGFYHWFTNLRGFPSQPRTRPGWQREL